MRAVASGPTTRQASRPSIDVLEETKKRFQDLRPLAEAVGVYMVGQTQKAFREQRRGSQDWPARSVPNRMGVLVDLKNGKTPPSRRWDARPAGIDTSRLRQSIAFRVDGGKVIVGSNLPYASDVQRGATKTIQLDGPLRHALADWLRSLPKGKRAAARQAFGFMFHQGSFTVTTPPRPFLMVTPEDRRQINRLCQRFFGGHS